MALVLADRVRETTVTTGQGAVSLAGAVPGYQTFSVIGNANTTYYCIAGQGTTEWEVGIGTYTSSGTSLSRDTVLASSNSGALVSFSTGVKDVFCTYPAETSVSDGKTNVIEVSSTDAALRITQLGTGDALLVEDSTNPDSTPFVINSTGVVVRGAQSSYQTVSITSATTPNLQTHGTALSSSAIGQFSWGSNPYYSFNKSGSTTIGDYTSVISGNILGRIQFNGADGTGFVGAAIISGEVDGTPGTGDMPGRLVFSTTADGSATPTERMRIDSSGVTTLTGTGIINADSTSDALRITQVGTGNALVVEDSTNPDSTPFVIDASGNIYSGYTTPFNYTSVGGGSLSPRISIAGTNADTSTFGASLFANTASGPTVVGAKSRDATVGNHTVVQSGDALLNIIAEGSDGTGFIRAATIIAAVDGTPGTNDMPGRLVFSTTADGASTPTERMRIDSAGNVGIGIATSAGIVAPLQVSVGEPGGETIRLAWNTGSTTQGFSSIGFSTTQSATQPNALIRGEEIDTSDYRGNLLFATRATNVSTDAPTTRVTIDYNGLVTLASGSGLSISATGVTSPAAGDGNVFSGTYTPSLTNTTNVTSSSAVGCHYMRVGNVVTVSGQVLFQATSASTDTQMDMTLPIASDLTASRQLGGAGGAINTGEFGESVAILGLSASDAAAFRCRPSVTTNQTYNFSFTYLVN